MTHRPLQLSALILASVSLPLLHASSSFAQAQPALVPPAQAQPAPAQPASEPPKQPPIAKTENQIKAGELFSEARKLVEAGDYKQACPKFEQSMSLNFGIGVQFNLADCWERIGRNASAQALFQGVAASARAAGQTERAQVAQARAQALEPRLVRLLIDVKATDPALSVRRNRIFVDQKAWGAATPVDAGEYLIEAAAPGKKPWSARVIVPVSATEVVSIVVPPLDPAEPTKALSDAPKEAPKKPPPPEPKPARHSAYAYALGGLGIVSLGVGTALAVSFKSKNNDAKAICPSGVDCSQADIDRHAELVSDAKGLRTGAFISFGVGAAALIAGTVLYFAPSSSSNTAGLGAAPFVTADGTWGAVASGRF